MKEYLKLFGKGTVFGLGFFFVLLVLGTVTFFVIKSRTATDPGLGDNGSSLYTSVNETLTAAKRNALVKSTKRVDVPTSDTALFDLNCERRIRGDSGQGCGQKQYMYPIMTIEDGTKLYFGLSNGDRVVSNTTKNKVCLSTNCATYYCNLGLLQKKCQ